MKTKVYIDGQSGTTGLQIYDRIGARDDIELLRIPEDKRHDIDERKKYINSADIVFLCLPDAGSIEAVSLVENDNVRIIDASTAHRVNDDWVYGYPELSPEQREKIRLSKRVANVGCHASGFISVTAPLVKLGILPDDYPVTCYSLTGYSGGGKKMIADYEADGRDEKLSSPCIYGLTLKHKHLPEMVKYSGLKVKPVFMPVVDDYYKGMATTVMLHNDKLNGIKTAEDVRNAIYEYYKNEHFVRVREFEAAPANIYANQLAGTNYLDIIVCGNDEQTTLTALFDNLGKGASGAAVQNMNIMLGIPENTGLE